MGKAEKLKSILQKFVRDTGSIGAMLVTKSGLVISAEVPVEFNVNLVSAMSATIFGTAQRVVDEMKIGKLTQNLIEGEEGKILVIPINDDVLFCALLKKEANIGLIYIEVGKIIKNLKELL